MKRRAGCNQYAGAAQLGALGAVRTFRREGDRLLLLDETEHVRVRLGPLR